MIPASGKASLNTAFLFLDLYQMSYIPIGTCHPRSLGRKRGRSMSTYKTRGQARSPARLSVFKQGKKAGFITPPDLMKSWINKIMGFLRFF